MDGECNSLRKIEGRDGDWEHWCYVNKDQNCKDIVDGWSFEACKTGNINKM